MIAGLQRSIEILEKERDTSPVPEVFDYLISLLSCEIEQVEAGNIVMASNK